MSGWTVTRLEGSLGPFGPQWEALNRAAFGNHPLLSGIFVNGLLQQFGEGNEHLCVFESSAGTVQAMCILKPRSRLIWSSFLPSQAQLGLTLIADARLLPALVKRLPFPVVQLDLLCNDPAVGHVVSSSLPPTSRLNHALTMQITLNGTFEEYWKSRSKNLQSNIKRYEKRLQTDGLNAEFLKVTAPQHITAAVDRYAALENSGWKGRQGTALGSTTAQFQFYRDLMLAAAQDGDAIVFEMWVEKKLAASRLVIRRGHTQVILKTTYDEALANYAPGRLQLRMVIEDAFSSIPGGQLEFYTDANSDQLAWATGERWIQHATVYPGHLLEMLLSTVRALRTSPVAPVPSEEGEADKNALKVEAFPHPSDLPPAAKKLLVQAERRSVEQGLTWYSNLVDTIYPDHANVRFYVLSQGEQVLGVMPIKAEKTRLGWRIESLSNFYTAIYEPALLPHVKPNELVILLSAVQRDYPGLASVNLAPLNPQSHAYQTMLAACRLQGWVPFEYFSFSNWFLPVTDTWTDYLAAREGKLRNTLKRMEKKFRARGGRFQLVTSPAELPIAIAAYSQVYAVSSKKAEPFASFIPGLLQNCANQGWLRLGLAWFNDKPIAAQLWIVANGRAEIYKLAYDVSFKAFSPGTLVSAMLMQHVMEIDKVHEVDYLIGDDPYKKSWMSHRRDRWGIVAYNPRSLGGLAKLVPEVLGRWAKPWIARFAGPPDKKTS